MKMSLLLVFLMALLPFRSLLAQEQVKAGDPDGAYLDPRYPPALRLWSHFDLEINALRVNSRNDVESVIGQQSSVKAQGKRGTCSIFSAAGILESLLISVFGMDPSINLSEEWLQYVTHFQSVGEGSTSSANFRAIAGYGMPSEELLPYIGENWVELPTLPLAQKRCGDLLGNEQISCLLGHRKPRLLKLPANLLQALDPELLLARDEAFMNRDRYFQSLKVSHVKTIYVKSEIKNLLDAKVPVTLDIDFYYGAWNHREATALGMTRNMNHWTQGIVGYPIRGSKDREVSLQKPAGHSIVLVGYDDEVEVTIQSLMTDGSVKEFTQRGVYYFKNSWGTESFGVDFELNGRAYPGYGMITQAYAHEFGQFFQLPLQQ